MDGFKKDKVSVRNVLSFISEGAKSSKINHQEAQLLRSLVLVEYGKSIRRDAGIEFYPEVSGESDNIFKDKEERIPVQPSVLSFVKENILVRPVAKTHTSFNTILKTQN